MAIFEMPWFKWAAVSAGITFSSGAAGFFILDELLERREKAELVAAREAARRDYEDLFRSTMVRVYQNLRLEHYLAAFKNIEDFESPPVESASMHREFWETMMRVADGLLENRFLDESESIYTRLQHLDGYEDVAREKLIKIASARRYESAKNYVDQGLKLLEEGRYVDSANELRKAKLEYDSVELYKVQDVSQELLELSAHLRRARYHVHIQSADRGIAEAIRRLEAEDFKETQKLMTQASGHVGRAAFYSSMRDSSVLELRKQLISLKSELAFRVPNATPIYNRFSEDQAQIYPNFFRLENVEIDFNRAQPNEISFNINYKAKTDPENYYIIRYKTYFFNGKDYFNGQSVPAEESELSINDVLPPEFQGQAVKRIDLSVYNQENVLISRIMRAYRRP